MSRMSQCIRTLCAISFVSVAASALVPMLSHANEAPTAATRAAAPLPAGAAARVNGQVIAQSTLH